MYLNLKKRRKLKSNRWNSKTYIGSYYFYIIYYISNDYHILSCFYIFTYTFPFLSENHYHVVISNEFKLKGNNSGSGKQQKVDWNEKNHDIFVKVCVEQVQVGNRPHTHFNKVRWANVIKNFNKQTRLSYEYKQMKNKWDLLRK